MQSSLGLYEIVGSVIDAYYSKDMTQAYEMIKGSYVVIVKAYEFLKDRKYRCKQLNLEESIYKYHVVYDEQKIMYAVMALRNIFFMMTPYNHTREIGDCKCYFINTCDYETYFILHTVFFCFDCLNDVAYCSFDFEVSSNEIELMQVCYNDRVVFLFNPVRLDKKKSILSLDMFFDNVLCNKDITKLMYVRREYMHCIMPLFGERKKRSFFSSLIDVSILGALVSLDNEATNDNSLYALYRAYDVDGFTDLVCTTKEICWDLRDHRTYKVIMYAIYDVIFLKRLYMTLLNISSDYECIAKDLTLYISSQKFGNIPSLHIPDNQDILQMTETFFDIYKDVPLVYRISMNDLLKIGYSDYMVKLIKTLIYVHMVHAKINLHIPTIQIISESIHNMLY